MTGTAPGQIEQVTMLAATYAGQVSLTQFYTLRSQDP